MASMLGLLNNNSPVSYVKYRDLPYQNIKVGTAIPQTDFRSGATMAT